MTTPANGVKPLERSRRRSGKGSLATGWGCKNVSPRLAVSFEPHVMAALYAEALALGVPTAEIVRRRVNASYLAVSEPIEHINGQGAGE